MNLEWLGWFSVFALYLFSWGQERRIHNIRMDINRLRRAGDHNAGAIKHTLDALEQMNEFIFHARTGIEKIQQEVWEIRSKENDGGGSHLPLSSGSIGVSEVKGDAG